MIANCPECGRAIPMDARTRYEHGECPRCRNVLAGAANKGVAR